MDTDKQIENVFHQMNKRALHEQCTHEIIQTKGQSGTWMHRILALKFAAWLDTKFEIWVFSTIDQILLVAYCDQKDATTERLNAERSLEIKKRELIDKYPEFIDFLDLQDKVIMAEKRRIKAVKESVRQLKLELFL